MTEEMYEEDIKDHVENSKIELKNTQTSRYKARQHESFNHLGTTGKDWEMCDVPSFDSDGTPNFYIPVGYTFVTPFSDTASKEELEKLHSQIENSEGRYNALCELCGHLIKQKNPIKCDSKSYYMYIGSECINNFKGEGYFKQTIKEFRENNFRNMFRNWIGAAIVECSQFKAYDRYQRQIIEFKHYKFRKKLLEIRNDDLVKEISTRKLKNIMKEAHFNLGMKIPRGIIDDIDYFHGCYFRTPWKKYRNYRPEDLEKHDKRIDEILRKT